MLSLVELGCGYGQIRAVSDLSLEVAAGSVFALVGANGAGKSSTIMAIAGHVEITAGRIRLAGEDITDLPTRERVRAGIALSPEGRRLFPDLSVAENLVVGGFSQPRRLERERRDEVFDLFPRLGERRRQRAGSLSGGEQQMLAIGRALMAAPRLLLIDELSLGLMPKMVDLCYEAIDRLRARGIAVLLVEQSTQRALEIADGLCVLESGRAVWHGTASQARSDSTLAERYLGIARAREGDDARA